MYNQKEKRNIHCVLGHEPPIVSVLNVQSVITSSERLAGYHKFCSTARSLRFSNKVRKNKQCKRPRSEQRPPKKKPMATRISQALHMQYYLTSLYDEMLLIRQIDIPRRRISFTSQMLPAGLTCILSQIWTKCIKHMSAVVAVQHKSETWEK